MKKLKNIFGAIAIKFQKWLKILPKIFGKGFSLRTI
jgi:hypothetical protein